MDHFSTISSGTRTLNTSHDTAPAGLPRLECPQAKSRSLVNSSRRQNSFQIKRTYEPYINEERFKEKRVSPTQRRAAKKLKSALTIQRVYRGYRVRKWVHEHLAALLISKRVQKACALAYRVRSLQHR